MAPAFVRVVAKGARFDGDQRGRASGGAAQVVWYEMAEAGGIPQSD